MKILKTFTLVILSLILADSAFGQAVVSRAEILSSGTARGQSSSFTLTTTLGEPATGVGSSSSFGAKFGFWNAVEGLSYGSIRGVVFNDHNGNGIRDFGEGGLAGKKVMLSGSRVDSVLTDSSGNYSFRRLFAGSYIVGQVIPTGWLSTLPASAVYNIQIRVGQEISDLDFGTFKLGYITGLKFHDINNNGIRDGADSGLASWRIRLAKDGLPFDSALTSATGSYSFPNLTPGTYTVSEGILATWTQTLPSFPGTYSEPLRSGDSLTNRNFGNYQQAAGTVTVRKWRDPDSDVSTSTGRTPAAWSLRLYRDSVATSTLLIDTIATAFSVANLLPGRYIAVEADSSGWIPIGRIRNGTTLIPGPATRDTFTLGTNQSYTIEFVNFQPNRLVVRKFRDMDGNLATTNDLVRVRWGFELWRGTQAEPVSLVDSVASADSMLVTGLASGTYHVYEGDSTSAGWTRLRRRLNNSNLPSPTLNWVQFTADSGRTVFVDFVNTRVGSITVAKFLDLDGDFRSLSGTPKPWALKLYRDSIASSNLVDSVVSATVLSRTNLPEGKYVAVEADSGHPWSHIGTVLMGKPGGNITVGGGHNSLIFQLGGGENLTAQFWNFNRNRVKIWSAAQDCDWFNGFNWNPQGVPIPGDSVVVPDTARCALLIPPNSSIGTLTIAAGETVRVQPGGTFAIRGDMTIRGTLFVDPTGTPIITVEGGWRLLGQFVPGRSTVVFAGTDTQRIAGGSFFNFQVGGGGGLFTREVTSGLSRVFTDGNVYIGGSLRLNETVDARQDTIFISNAADTAMQGPGIVRSGTIRRAIQANSLARYRFESDSTYTRFDGSGIYPSQFYVRTYPDTNPSHFTGSGRWVLVPSTVDTAANVVSANNVQRFSKWAFGTGVPGLSFEGTGRLSELASTVRRVYSLEPAGGNGYRARVALRYDQSELPPSTSEDSLKLWRLAFPPPTPLLVYPAEGTTGVPTSLTLRWNRSSGASSYHLQLSTDSLFGSFIMNDSTLADTGRVVSALSNNTRHFWRVSATNDDGKSDFSAPRSFRTVVAVPSAPSLVSPANGAVNRPTTLTFTWNATPTAESYHLQVASDSLFNNIVFEDNAITGTSREVGPLANLTLYFWRVRAQNVIGQGQFSSIWTFRTIVAFPSMPLLLSPANNAVNQPIVLTLSWQAAGKHGKRSVGAVLDELHRADFDALSNFSVGPENSDTTKYRIELARDSAFTAIVLRDSQLVSPSRNVGPLVNDSLYFWRVRAENIAGASGWSDIWKFRTIIAAPTVPILASPFNGAVNQPTILTLRWYRAARATAYRVMGANDSSFTSILFNSGEIPDTNWQTPTLPNGIRCFWRVSASNVSGTSGSQAWSFQTIVAVPSAPILASPINSSQNLTTTLTLRWLRSVAYEASRGSQEILETEGTPSWIEMSDSVRYRLEVAIDSGFVSMVYVDTSVTDTQRVVGPLQNGTWHWWRVRARNIGGQSSWSDVWNFRTIVTTPSQVALVSPPNQAVVSADTALLVWRLSTPEVERYWLELALDSLFQFARIDSNIVDTATVARNLINQQTYFWKARGRNAAGWGLFSEVRRFRVLITNVGENEELPRVFALKQNYPNPFNPRTVIRFEVPHEARVSVAMYNVLGQEVVRVVDNLVYSAGRYEAAVDASGLASGVYFYRMMAVTTRENSTGNFVRVMKMILLR